MESDSQKISRTSEEMRALLLAPTERDAQASRQVLATEGILCVSCEDLRSLCEEIRVGAGVVIVPEELVLADSTQCLKAAIEQQPIWSDLPVIVLSRAGMESVAVQKAMTTLPNLSVIERPLRITTLVSLIKTALHAREKQYQVRDLLIAREQSEKQLMAAKAAAEDAKLAADEANRAKDQFLAALSHELRTPLSPVVMTIDELTSDPELPAKVRDQLEVVKRNVALETRLIDDLLDVNRAVNGKLQLRPETASVHRLLGQVLAVCASDQFAKRLKVSTDFGASTDAVRADATRLQQVFWNLLKNAIKFSREGGEITVVTQDTADGRVRILVQDHGIGISQEVLPRLFTAFEQGALGTAHRFGGLGLGLAISRAIVELHGGTIRAESDGPGRGATFIVELPRTDEFPSPCEETPMLVPTHPRRYLRILLVEDHADSAAVLSRILRAWGHRVHVATTVESAMRAAEEGPFDLLISDIGLPDATGYDLMRQVREHHGEIPGIALSGYAMDDDISKSRQAGFTEHLAKPVNLVLLEEAIRKLAW